MQYSQVINNTYLAYIYTETFLQDLVRQARSIYIRDETGDKWKDTTTVVLSHIQQKVIDRQNKLFDNKQIDWYIKEVMNIII